MSSQLNEEDDASNTEHVAPDPAVEEIRRMASAPERAAAKRAKASKAKQEQAQRAQELEERRLALESEKLEAERVKEMHRKHTEMEKLRLEQQKQFAKASRVADEVKASVKAQQYDTAEKQMMAKDDAMRKVGQLQTQLGARGTGRRLTAANSLEDWLLELEVCNNQLNMERAYDVPVAVFYETLQLSEQMLAPFYNIDGLSKDVKEAQEASQRAPPGSLDSHLDRAIIQCSIEVSHLFAMSPRMFVALSVLKMAKRRHDLNKVARGHALDAEMSKQVEDEFEKMMHGGTTSQSQTAAGTFQE